MKKQIHAMTRLTILALMLSALMATAAAGATWYILPDGSGDQPTIQDGLNACADGDTVLVAAGTYYENLVWPNTQGIVLTSESGPEATIIDGNDAGRVIRLGVTVDASTTISYLTIQNGYIHGTAFAGSGGGIACFVQASPTIEGNIITSNEIQGHTIGGAGIACSASTAVIIDNTITHNTIKGPGNVAGAGIYCNYDSPTIIGNEIMYNSIVNATSGCSGGGIYFDECSPLVAENTISNNSTSYSGGGIGWGEDTAPIVRDNIIQDNSCALRGGGVFANDGAGGELAGNTIANNSATSGAGICLRSSSVNVRDNLIAENNAAEKGGGVYIYYSTGAGSETIFNNEIIGNISPAGTGGGVHLEGVSPVIDRCTIRDNGIGIYCDQLDGHMSTPSIYYNYIHDNAEFGLMNACSENEVDACGNWWGAACGPYHPTHNPGATCNAVSDHVVFDPWLGFSPVDDGRLPAVALEQNYPNPFNPITTIGFTLDRRQWSRIGVYELSGRRVMVLADRTFAAGRHTLDWTGQDAVGRAMSSGVYVVRMETESGVEVRKVSLVR